jgi:hypothetical protein
LNQKTTNQQGNIHRRAQWIDTYINKQKTKLSPENYKLLLDYNDDMIISSLSENTRYKNLSHYGKLTKMIGKDWKDITEQDVRDLVSSLMIKHGENGKESAYTFVIN